MEDGSQVKMTAAREHFSAPIGCNISSNVSLIIGYVQARFEDFDVPARCLRVG
jgi:hypothetical protein